MGSPKGRESYGDGVPVCSRRGNVRPIWRPGKPDHRAKLRRLTRRWITLTESRGSEGGRLWATRLTWTGNREGTTAWRESAGYCEGVYGAAAQGPCDMAKTGLFEAQFPGMEMCILRYKTPRAEPPVSGESPLLRPNLSGWWTVGSEPTQGNGQAAYVTLGTSSARGIRDHLRGASPMVTECQ
jgi:hypothetical protein